MAAIKAFLCGGPNSGKTVYLSALFKSMFVADQKIGLRCETTAAARSILSRIYNNLGKAWPLGTELVEQHEMPFSFYIDNRQNESFLAAEVTFFDFSGEAVAPSAAATNPRMEEIKALANACHVVMSVIDGELIYDSFIKNDGHPTPELLNIIDATLQIWTDHSSRKLKGRLNNYFLITKWDMFDESDASLRRIREMLLNIPLVANYIQRLDEDSIVRIIPVSAVGRDFARLNPTTGKMDILAKAPKPPINVDVPVACLMPDLINAELARSMEQLNEEAWRESQKKDSWWDKLKHFTGQLIQTPALTRLITDFGIHYDDIYRVATLLKDPLIKTHEQREAKIAELAALATSQKDATTIVQNYFDHLRETFERKYPSSLVRYPSRHRARGV